MSLGYRLIHRAGVECRFEGFQRISLRSKFVSDIEVVSRRGDGSANCGIVKFLGLIQITATGIPSRMEVTDPADILAQGTDHISFHDLHVINVVE